MFPAGVLIATFAILEAACSFPLEEKIEPVELFHHCIEPERHEKEPEKSPVILMHGLLGYHRSFDGIDRLIADKTKRRVCALDLRNHGNSPWNNRTDIAALAVDIGHFLDQQNIPKANLIGESLGGKVAIHYALNNPDRVDSIVVEDMRPNKLKETSIRAVKLMIRLAKGILASQPENMNEEEILEWAVQLYKKLVIDTFPNDAPSDVTKYLAFRLVDGKWQLKHNLELLYKKMDKPEEIWTESVGVYTGPTLFIYGMKSLFKVGDDKESILQLFPNAQFVPFEEAGHIIHDLHREFDDIVVKFLNEVN